MSFLSVAIEQHEGNSEEVEYSQFLKLSTQQLNNILERFSDCKKMLFSESKLNTEYGKSRLRHYLSNNEIQYELTTKTFSDTAKAKIETNVTIPEEIYKALNSSAISTVVRIRYFIPITKDGQILTKADGSNLEWELDCYVVAGDLNDGKIYQWSEWVKLELEVDKATLDNVVEFIPFEYNKIILADSTDAAERAQIEYLYNEVYNVRGKHTIS